MQQRRTNWQSCGQRGDHNMVTEVTFTLEWTCPVNYGVTDNVNNNQISLWDVAVNLSLLLIWTLPSVTKHKHISLSGNTLLVQLQRKMNERSDNGSLVYIIYYDIQCMYWIQPCEWQCRRGGQWLYSSQWRQLRQWAQLHNRETYETIQQVIRSTKSPSHWSPY